MIKCFGIMICIIGLIGVSFCDDKFNNDSLNAHNTYRKLHCVQPLQLNAKLNQVAQAYATKIAESKTMKHSGNGYGENIFVATFYPTGSQVSGAWYKEIKNYNYSIPKYAPNTGHFTQIIWADTKFVGFGIANATDGRTFVVANYDPPGNYGGEYPDNVKKPEC